MSHHQSEIIDEATYVKYAESFIFDLQSSFRKKPGVEHLAVIDMCMMLEDLCFTQALKEKSIPDNSLWSNKECVSIYQCCCEKLLRNVEMKDHYNWNAVLVDHDKNPKNVQFYILKEEDRKLQKTKYEQPYRPPKEKTRAPVTAEQADAKKAQHNPAKNLKRKTSTGSGGGGSGGNKKAKDTTAPLSMVWQGGPPPAPATSEVAASTTFAAAAAIGSDSLLDIAGADGGDFTLDLDLFDDPELDLR